MLTVDVLFLPSGNQIKHGWLENEPFLREFPIRPSMHSGFSIAMFDYPLVQTFRTEGGPGLGKALHHVSSCIIPSPPQQGLS